MEETLEFRQACTELQEILKFLVKEDYNKIPDEIIKNINLYALDNYNFQYDITKGIYEQNVSTDCKLMIAALFENFWATENQKEKLQDINHKYREQKYNTYNLFKKKTRIININDEDTTVDRSLLVIAKQSIFTNILNKIKNIFGLNK